MQTMANMEEEQDQALAELEATKADKAFEVKAAVKASQVKEQYHYTGIIGEERAKQNSLKERINAQKLVTTALVNSSVTAERAVRSTKWGVKTSAYRVTCMRLV